MAIRISVVGDADLRQLERAQRELDKIKQAAEKASGGIGRAVDKAGQQMSAAGDRIASTGDSLTRNVSLPLLAAGGAAVKMADQFNGAMANVAALGVPTQRVNELKTAVQDMAVATGKSTDDLAGGLYQVVSAFGDTADTTKILETNARAAVAGLASTTDSINLTSAVTKAYGDASAEAVEKVSNLALKTVEMGQTTFPELASSIGKVTPLANELGVSQEALFGTMATFTGVTGGAAEVATQLRGSLQAFLAPTADATKALKAAGFESGKAAVEQLGLQGALGLLTDAANKSGQPLAKYIGSIEGQTIALAGAGEMADTWTDKTAAMQGELDTLDTAWKAQTEGVNAAGFQLKQAQQQAAVAAQELGDALAPAIGMVLDVVRPMIGRLREAVTWFQGLDKGTQQTAIRMALLVVAAGPVLSVFGRVVAVTGKVVSGVGKTITVIGKMPGALAKAGKFVGTWAKNLAGFAAQVGRAFVAVGKAALVAGRAIARAMLTAAKAVGRAMLMIGRALMANPWILVVAAVVALVVVIVKNWDTIKQYLLAAWNWIKTTAGTVWAAITGAVSTAVNAVKQVVTSVMSALGKAVQAYLFGYLLAFKVAWAAVKWVVVNVIGGIADRIRRGLETVATIIRVALNLVAAGWKKVWGGISSAVTAVWNTIRSRVTSGVETIRSVVGRVLDSIRSKWDGIWGGMKDFAVRMLTGLVSAAKAPVNGVIRLINGFISGLNRINVSIPDFPGIPGRGRSFGFNIPSIPYLAKGGIVTGPTLAMVGEGANDEAVVPLPRGWRSGGGGLGGVNLTVHVDARGADATAVPAIRQAARQAADEALVRLVRELRAS